MSPDGQNIGGGQINLVHTGPRGVVAGWTIADLMDAAKNVEAAHRVWLSSGYGAWACY